MSGARTISNGNGGRGAGHLGTLLIHASTDSLVCVDTSQSEGCTEASWCLHKTALKSKFGGLVREVEAQRREQLAVGDQERGRNDDGAANQSVEQRPPVAGPEGAGNGNDEDGHDGHVTTTTSSSSILPCAKITRLKPIAAILSSVRSELGLPPSATISDSISQVITLLGLEIDHSMTIKDQVLSIARELNIAIMQELPEETDAGIRAGRQ